MKKFLLSCVLAALCACTALGVESPETFNQKLAVAVSSTTAVRETALTLLASGKITKADAQNLQNQADVAREGLDIAREVGRTDQAAGATRLEAVNATLRALQAYLLLKQGK